MPIVDIIQRSDKWFAWRKLGITASMIPVILGLSPYQTPYQLWAELVGLKQPDDLSNNYHVQRGVAQEPEARDAVENEYGKPYMPVCVEADHDSLFKASLDGLYKLGTEKEVLEIKCPCEKIYLEILALKGGAPTFQMYAAQVQWQLNCASATTGRLYFYLRGKQPISTLIRRNDAFIKKAEKAARHFWHLVQTKQAPEMIDGRDKVVYDTPIANSDSDWAAKVDQYKKKSARYEDLKRQCDAVHADLKNLESYFTAQIPDDVQTFTKDGIRATRVDRDGTVDHKKFHDAIERELNVEIPNSLVEACRSASSSYFRVTVKDEANKADVPIEQYVPTPTVDTQTECGATMTTAVVSVTQPVPESKPAEVVPTTEQQKEPQLEMARPLPADSYFESSNRQMYF